MPSLSLSTHLKSSSPFPNYPSPSPLLPRLSSLSLSLRRPFSKLPSFKVLSIDAAQPYDYETKLKKLTTIPQTTPPSPSPSQPTKLKIAIIGFGNYGQFLAKTITSQGHTVLAHSRTNYTSLAHSLSSSISFFLDPHDLCEQHPDVILFCTSILSTEPMLKSLPLQRLKRSTLFVDVLSVKEFPRSLFLQILPAHFDILCTHPMFGPESGKESWKGLPFVYDRVRIGSEERRVKRCEEFLNIFKKEGCRMEEMSCAEHDKYAAGSQFITHFVGRVLEKLELEDTPINTKGYESLLNLVENTSKDSFELFYGLFLYNGNAMEQLKRLDLAFELVKQQLFGHLHGLLRGQLFGSAEIDERSVRLKESGIVRSATKLLSEGSSSSNVNGNGSSGSGSGSEREESN